MRSPEVQIDGEFTLLAGSTVKSDPQGVSNADSAILRVDVRTPRRRHEAEPLTPEMNLVAEVGLGL